MNLAIVEQIGLYIPLVLGAYLSISLMKIPNLSIEAAYVFGAIIASQVLMFEGNSGMVTLLLAVILSACGGAMVGIVAATLCQAAQFSHILSAIITMGLFHGIAQWVMGGAHVTISHLYNPLRLLDVVKEFPELPVIVLIVVGVCLLFYMFLKTELGISCALYGDNIVFLKNYRMNQSYVVVAGMAISGALAGISGYMVAQSNGFADSTMGVGLPLLCLSSLIIGKSLYHSDRPIQMSSALVGVVGYFMVQTVLLRIGFDLRYFTSVQAILVATLLIISSRLFVRRGQQNFLGI